MNRFPVCPACAQLPGSSDLNKAGSANRCRLGGANRAITAFPTVANAGIVRPKDGARKLKGCRAGARVVRGCDDDLKGDTYGLTAARRYRSWSRLHHRLTNRLPVGEDIGGRVLCQI